MNLLGRLGGCGRYVLAHRHRRVLNSPEKGRLRPATSPFWHADDALVAGGVVLDELDGAMADAMTLSAGVAMLKTAPG